jgi:hypothetical protein
VVSESLAQDGGGDGVPPRAAPDQMPRPRKRKPSGVPCPARDAKYELTDEDREWARRAGARLPPLTDR